MTVYNNYNTLLQRKEATRKKRAARGDHLEFSWEPWEATKVQGLMRSIDHPTKVGAIRNRHPYVITYVSAKTRKIFDSGKKNLGGTIFGTKQSQSYCKCA